MSLATATARTSAAVGSDIYWQRVVEMRRGGRSEWRTGEWELRKFMKLRAPLFCQKTLMMLRLIEKYLLVFFLLVLTPFPVEISGAFEPRATAEALKTFDRECAQEKEATGVKLRELQRTTARHTFSPSKHANTHLLCTKKEETLRAFLSSLIFLPSQRGESDPAFALNEGLVPLLRLPLNGLIAVVLSTCKIESIIPAR